MKKKLLVLGLVIVLVVGFVTMALAQEGPRQFSDEKLREIAELIVKTNLGDNLSREQEKRLDKLASQFTEKDVEVLTRFVLILRGYSPEEANEIIEKLKEEGEKIKRLEEREKKERERLNKQSLRTLYGPCSQMVEEQWVDGVKSDYVAHCDCDGDPSDMDYHFRFWLWWNGDPDLIRWYSTHWWVRFIFRAWYGGRLLGDSFCGIPKWLCIGERGVTAAGGPSFVRDRLYLGHL